MRDDEVEAFFALYVEREERRRAEFRREVADTGGPSESDLDGSPESLVPLWTWMVGRIEAWQAEPLVTEWPLLPDGPPLPPWYQVDSPEQAAQRLRPQVIWDVDGLAYELAEVCRRAAPELHWVIARRPRHLAYAYQNHPVLQGYGVDIDPRSVCYGLAVRVQLMAAGREPDRLLRTFRAWEPAWTSTKRKVPARG
jgi:hypothetical protein